MNRPYKYSAIHNITGEIRDFNQQPLNHQFEEWQKINDTDSIRVMNWIFYIDTRYAAKLRLYNYLTFTKQGKEIPRYNPYAGTEIGKSIPILNF